MELLEIKIWLESSTGLERDALHIYCALAIQFSLSLFLRRGLASPWPWIAVLIAALTNEYFDYQRVGESEASILFFKQEAYHDMWNTMLIPSALMLIARFWPRWMTGKHQESEVAYAGEVQSDTTS